MKTHIIIALLFVQCVAQVNLESVLPRVGNMYSEVEKSLVSCCSKAIYNHIQGKWNYAGLKQLCASDPPSAVEHLTPLGEAFSLCKKINNAKLLSNLILCNIRGRVMQNLVENYKDNPEGLAQVCQTNPNLSELKVEIYSNNPEPVFCLQYSPNNLEVFPKHCCTSTHPELLAEMNHALSNRNGLGFTLTDRGWKIVQRNLIQLAILTRNEDRNPIHLPVKIIARVITDNEYGLYKEGVLVLTDLTRFYTNLNSISKVICLQLPEISISQTIISTHPELLNLVNNERHKHQFLSCKDGNWQFVRDIADVGSSETDVRISIIVQAAYNDDTCKEYTSINEFNDAMKDSKIYKVLAIILPDF